MDGALVYSPLRNADPLFREEKAFLTASSVVCGVELKWLDFLEAESYLETRFKKIDFLYFYDEDLYLEDLAVRLGIPDVQHAGQLPARARFGRVLQKDEGE